MREEERKLVAALVESMAEGYLAVVRATRDEMARWLPAADLLREYHMRARIDGQEQDREWQERWVDRARQFLKEET